MALSLRAFDFAIDSSGAYVVARRDPLCAGCMSDEEIDANIGLLKADLDAVAARMKAALREQAAEPIFSGERG